MGKKAKLLTVEESSASDEEQEQEDNDQSFASGESMDSDERIAMGDKEKNGQKEINDEEGMERRLEEIKKNFYNRLESAKLIKKHGRVPFTEHMTVPGKETVNIPEGLAAVNDDIKREIAL